MAEAIAFAMGQESEDGRVFAREVSSSECGLAVRLKWTLGLVMMEPTDAIA
jgi:hypothetical protein